MNSTQYADISVIYLSIDKSYWFFDRQDNTEVIWVHSHTDYFNLMKLKLIKTAYCLYSSSNDIL